MIRASSASSSEFAGRSHDEEAREIVVLVKPQFEVGRELVGKGGIVRDESAQRGAMARVEAALAELGCRRRMDRISDSRAARATENFFFTQSFQRRRR